jgi:hypothetical protein
MAEASARAGRHQHKGQEVSVRSPTIMSQRFAKLTGVCKTVDECPDAARRHTPHPQGYIAFSEWAREKAKTHAQRRCPTCGFLSIWTRRR